MESEGDLRVQRRTANGGYAATNGYVNLQGRGRLTVHGDFYTQSTKAGVDFCGDLTPANAATLELHGDFHQLGADGVFKQQRTSSLRTVFAGAGDQHVYVENYGTTTVGGVEKAAGTGAIVLDSPIREVLVSGSATVSANGHTVERIQVLESGLLRMWGDVRCDYVSLAGGSLACDGDLEVGGIPGHSNGEDIINLSRSALVVGGTLSLLDGKSFNVPAGSAVAVGLRGLSTSNATCASTAKRLS